MRVESSGSSQGKGGGEGDLSDWIMLRSRAEHEGVGRGVEERSGADPGDDNMDWMKRSGNQRGGVSNALR